MRAIAKNVDGHYYPEFHHGWGGCAEELFHYTSRYYTYTEAFLRNLAGEPEYSMGSYKANMLNDEQRRLMAAILSCRPDRASARAILHLVSDAEHSCGEVEETLRQTYREQLEVIPSGVALVYVHHPHESQLQDVAPLDPFLNIAERLQLPVAVKAHHVEVPLKLLARQMDSSSSRIRESLNEAILRLHTAGYLLRNHPGLTHMEAHKIADEDAV